MDVFPTLGDMGASNPRIVAPGDPDNSTLYLRMLTLGTFRMPALATSIVDVQGAGLVRRWILGLAPPTVVADNLTEPTSSTLEPNFPNPLNSSTNLSYHLQQSRTVHLAIYSSVGRLVRPLDGTTSSGMASTRRDSRPPAVCISPDWKPSRCAR